MVAPTSVRKRFSGAEWTKQDRFRERLWCLRQVAELKYSEPHRRADRREYER